MYIGGVILCRKHVVVHMRHVVVHWGIAVCVEACVGIHRGRAVVLGRHAVSGGGVWSYIEGM
jgi:hypothetical protein